jgi:hypothetical protein
VQVLGIVVFPLFAVGFQAVAQVLGFEFHCADDERGFDLLNLLLSLGELLKLILVGLQLRLLMTFRELLDMLLNAVLPEPVVLPELRHKLQDFVLGALDGTREKENNLDDFPILCDHLIQGLFLISISILLIPVIQLFGAPQNCRGCLINGLLDLLKRRIEPHLTTRQLHIDLKERIQLLLLPLTPTHPILHGIERILGGIQQRLIQIPEIEPLNPLRLIRLDRVDPHIQRVQQYRLDQIVDGPLDLHVLTRQKVLLLIDVLLLHTDEVLQWVRHVLVRQRDEGDLADVAQVVFDTVFDYVVDVDDQLLEFVEALVDVVQV